LAAKLGGVLDLGGDETKPSGQTSGKTTDSKPPGADTTKALACSQCGKPDATKVCSRCKAARYCSKECQVRHWGEGHKLACQVQDLCPKCHAPMGSAGAKGALCARCSE
jgi:hypothetical protein